jgi:hypothetical protein
MVYAVLGPALPRFAKQGIKNFGSTRKQLHPSGILNFHFDGMGSRPIRIRLRQRWLFLFSLFKSEQPGRGSEKKPGSAPSGRIPI